MWDEPRQTRLKQLHEAEAQRTLTAAEEAELAALIEERCRYEEAAIGEATRRTEAESARLARQVQQVEAQNRALEELVREQEAYLAEVQEMVAGMEARREQWRERYARVTGRPLGEAVAPRGSR
jgi:tryptophan 2,3-dioxygenase